LHVSEKIKPYDSSGRKANSLIYHQDIISRIEPEMKDYATISQMAKNLGGKNHVTVIRAMHSQMNEQEYNDYITASTDLSNKHPTLFYGPLITEKIKQKKSRVQIMDDYDLDGSEYKRIYIEYNSILENSISSAIDKYDQYMNNENKELKFYNLYKHLIPSIETDYNAMKLNISQMIKKYKIGEPALKKIINTYIDKTIRLEIQKKQVEKVFELYSQHEFIKIIQETTGLTRRKIFKILSKKYSKKEISQYIQENKINAIDKRENKDITFHKPHVLTKQELDARQIVVPEWTKSLVEKIIILKKQNKDPKKLIDKLINQCNLRNLSQEEKTRILRSTNI